MVPLPLFLAQKVRSFGCNSLWKGVFGGYTTVTENTDVSFVPN
jgi:hypothetical protein